MIFLEKTPEYAWAALEKCFDEKIKPNYGEIKFEKTKKGSFIEAFIKLYKEVIECYMDENTKCLDRHKQAAILICCVLKENILTSQNAPKGKRFVGKYSVALSLGLSFMLDRLNERLEDVYINDKIEDLTDITALACPTEYFDVLFRNLYFEEEKQGSVFVLTLANTLFLLEYITLLKKGIDINKLKEYNQEENKDN